MFFKTENARERQQQAALTTEARPPVDDTGGTILEIKITFDGGTAPKKERYAWCFPSALDRFLFFFPV